MIKDLLLIACATVSMGQLQSSQKAATLQVAWVQEEVSEVDELVTYLLETKVQPQCDLIIMSHIECITEMAWVGDRVTPVKPHSFKARELLGTLARGPNAESVFEQNILFPRDDETFVEFDFEAKLWYQYYFTTFWDGAFAYWYERVQNQKLPPLPIPFSWRVIKKTTDAPSQQNRPQHMRAVAKGVDATGTTWYCVHEQETYPFGVVTSNFESDSNGYKRGFCEVYKGKIQVWKSNERFGVDKLTPEQIALIKKLFAYGSFIPLDEFAQNNIFTTSEYRSLPKRWKAWFEKRIEPWRQHCGITHIDVEQHNACACAIM